MCTEFNVGLPQLPYTDHLKIEDFEDAVRVFFVTRKIHVWLCESFPFALRKISATAEEYKNNSCIPIFIWFEV